MLLVSLEVDIYTFMLSITFKVMHVAYQHAPFLATTVASPMTLHSTSLHHEWK